MLIADPELLDHVFSRKFAGRAKFIGYGQLWPALFDPGWPPVLRNAALSNGF